MLNRPKKKKNYNSTKIPKKQLSTGQLPHNALSCESTTPQPYKCTRHTKNRWNDWNISLKLLKFTNNRFGEKTNKPWKTLNRINNPSEAIEKTKVPSENEAGITNTPRNSLESSKHRRKIYNYLKKNQIPGKKSINCKIAKVKW